MAEKISTVDRILTDLNAVIVEASERTEDLKSQREGLLRQVRELDAQIKEAEGPEVAEARKMLQQLRFSGLSRQSRPRPESNE